MTTLHLPNHQPTTNTIDPDRVPLARLAAGRGAGSPALARVVPRAADGRGPGRVAVAAFQSSV